jgi:putative membrane protein
VIVRPTPPWGRVLGDIGGPLAGYTVLAVVVSVAHVHFGATWLAIPALPVSILAATLGILLSFRNNSGYDRWWEARTLWGGIVNASRSFARQLLTFLPAGVEDTSARVDGRGDRILRASAVMQSAAGHEGAPAAWTRSRATDRVRPTDGAVRDFRGKAAGAPTGEWAVPARDEAEPCSFVAVSGEARELVYAQIGFVNALRCHLRRQDPMPEIAPFFRAPVLAALHDEQNVPAAILVWMAARLQRALDAAARDGTSPVDATLRMTRLDQTLSELTGLLGACERIKNTPIPRQYDSLPRVMVRVYLAILPLSMVNELALVTPAVTAIIAVLFLSLDAIGRNVETPFENDIHDTPMTALCRTIEINLRQMLGETDLPPAVQPVDGFLY